MYTSEKRARMFPRKFVAWTAALAVVCLSSVVQIRGDGECPLTCGVVEDPCYCEPPSNECICVNGVCTPHYVTYEDTFDMTQAPTGSTCLGAEGVECGFYWTCVTIATQSSCANNAGCKHLGSPHPAFAVKYTTGSVNCSPPT